MGERMRKILIILSLFLVFCKYAISEKENDRWIWYSKTNEGEYYYDIESINWISDDVVEVWDKIIYSENSELKKKLISILIEMGVKPKKATRFSESKILHQIDIKNKKIIVLSSVSYDKNGNVLNILNSSDYYDVSTWGPIVPDSADETLWKIMCALKEIGKLKGEKVMCEFQKIEKLKGEIERDPNNPIFYHLLSKSYSNLVPYGIEEPDKFKGYALLYSYKAAEVFSEKTFPIEMVELKNAEIGKEDLLKILKAYFWGHTRDDSKGPFCNEAIESFNEGIKVWESKVGKIPLKILFSFKTEGLVPPEKQPEEISIADLYSLLGYAYYYDKKFYEDTSKDTDKALKSSAKACEYLYKAALYHSGIEHSEETLEFIKNTQKLISEIDPSSFYIKQLDYIKQLEEKIKEKYPVKIEKADREMTEISISSLMSIPDWYLSSIHKKIKENWRIDNIFGERTAIVSFRVYRDGRIEDISLEKSSGDTRFDRSVLEAVISTRQAPPFPAEITHNYLDIIIDFKTDF